MDELGPESRALLDAAREGLSPDPAAIHRVHGRIHAAAAGAPVGTGVGIKLGIAGVVATVAIVGGFYLRHAAPAPSAAMPSIELARPVERPERAAADKATPSSDEDLITIESPSGPIRRGDSNRGSTAHGAPAPLRVAPAAPGAALSHATADDSHRTTAIPSRHAVAIGDSHHAGAAQPAASSPREAAGAPTGIELSREVALIDLAMSALRRDDAAAALRVVQEYAAEAGEGGQLRQDAAAIEIEALCKLGDSGARDKRTAFDARFPHSAQRARLEAACR
jgi:hypothetical protein